MHFVNSILLSITNSIPSEVVIPNEQSTRVKTRKIGYTSICSIESSNIYSKI